MHIAGSWKESNPQLWFLVAGLLSNISRHSANRTLFYKFELSSKHDQWKERVPIAPMFDGDATASRASAGIDALTTSKDQMRRPFTALSAASTASSCGVSIHIVIAKEFTVTLIVSKTICCCTSFAKLAFPSFESTNRSSTFYRILTQRCLNYFKKKVHL